MALLAGRVPTDKLSAITFGFHPISFHIDATGHLSPLVCPPRNQIKDDPCRFSITLYCRLPKACTLYLPVARKCQNNGVAGVGNARPQISLESLYSPKTRLALDCGDYLNPSKLLVLYNSLTFTFVVCKWIFLYMVIFLYFLWFFRRSPFLSPDLSVLTIFSL